jgi:ketosteroid isomerase-like protein
MPHTILRTACALSFFLFFSSFSSAQELSPRQKEVWQMEQLYWKDVKDANATHYMTLWHEEFLGWPSFSPHPVGKDGIADSLAAWFAGFVSYEFLEKSVRVTGDIGITQYAVNITRTKSDGTLATNVTRITHTWLKTKSTWQIIGGMSAVVSSSAPPVPSAAAPSFVPFGVRRLAAAFATPAPPPNRYPVHKRIPRKTANNLKTKNTWQIIAGMSAVVSLSSAPAPPAAAPSFVPAAPALPAVSRS